ncbi:MAG: ECF transporter S component [Dorea sp.]|nr:ECF transporter S component [Dorea sp.]MDY2814814.1 ECF transporter S component [Dorea sp.]
MSTNTMNTGSQVTDGRVKAMVVTAFFAAITFLGIQSFRIPLPAAIGTPFVHFGHIFVVMGVLLQGGKRGAVSGTFGLIIFDILNGYLQDVPQVFIETVVKCLIVGAIFMILKKKAQGDKKKEYGYAIICAVIYGCMNIVIELVMGTIRMMILGSGFAAAVAGSVASIPATVINAVFMIIAIAVLYQPVKSIYRRVA